MPPGEHAMHASPERTIKWWEDLQRILDELEYDPELRPSYDEAGDLRRNLFETFLKAETRKNLRAAITNLMQLFPFPKLGLRETTDVRPQISLEELGRALGTANHEICASLDRSRDCSEAADALLLASVLLCIQFELVRLDKYARRGAKIAHRAPLESGIYRKR